MATVSRLTLKMMEEYYTLITGPKKLVQAWEMTRNPLSIFEYMLEKKLLYHELVEKYKAL